MTWLSRVWSISPMPKLTALLGLFSGEYSEMGLPHGFIGQMAWAYYVANVLELKVYNRNRAFTKAYCNAVYADNYVFWTTWWWAVLYKIIWPELLEFDIDEIETRGTGPTVAEATAIHYFGEEAGEKEDQDLFIMWIGQFRNMFTINMTAAYANEFFIEFIA